MSVEAQLKEFMKAFEALCRKHTAWRVWSDFCEMAAIEYQNAFIKDPTREARYIEIGKAYAGDDYKAMCDLFAMMVSAHEDAVRAGTPVDFLGDAFMRLGLSSHWHGQFFTPMHMSVLMAKTTLGDGEAARAAIAQNGLLTVQEPSCGAGAMLIAFLFECKALGINFQQDVFCVAIDVDPTAARMAYIQLATLGAPAAVYVGNTLSMEIKHELLTPFYWMGAMPWKVKRWRAGQAPSVEIKAVSEAAPATVEQVQRPVEQMDLFGAFDTEIRKGPHERSSSPRRNHGPHRGGAPRGANPAALPRGEDARRD